MRYFVVSDVHGFYNEMRRALDNAGFDPTNPNHCFVSCGDLLDRGTQPKECLEYVLNLNPNRRILIYGNHEHLMEQAIARGAFLMHDAHNGTMATAIALTDLSPEQYSVEGSVAAHLMRDCSLYNKYIKACVIYHETSRAVFVHGWIPCEKEIHKNKTFYRAIKDWRKADLNQWLAAAWYNGMDAWNQGVRVDNKTVFCGHWHTSWGHARLHNDGEEWPNKYSTNPDHRRANYAPFIDNGIVALDGCTVVSHRVNCFIWEE